MANTAHTPIPSADTPAASNPWERFAWSPVQQGHIYRDWGLYLSYKDQIKNAEKCYDNCLEINPRDARALYMRSLCKRSVANTKSALEDALAAAEIDNFNAAISSAICNALHDLNEFESCKAELHDNTRKFSSTVVKNFFNHIIVIDQTLFDCLGDSLGYFMLRNDKSMKKVIEILKHGEIKDPRPRWKILRDQNLCDVLSIPEIEEKLLCPRELARRELWLKVFNQIYFGRSWVDVAFMRNIQKNDSLPSNVVPLRPLSRLTAPNYEVIKKFVRMLHARSPLYNEFRTKFKDEQLFKRHKSNYLNFKQYETRRNMCVMLRLIKAYRKNGEIEKMCRYVESFMGDYVVLKTDRIMPWKFEFVNEVYNTLALAHADRYSLTEQILLKFGSLIDIRQLLEIRYESADRATTVEFGKKEKYFPNALSAIKEEKYQKFLAHLEKRKVFAKYSIERCYLWYEIARTNYKLGRCDMCCSAARKAIDESKNCNSNIWEFLSMMLIVKAYATLRRVEYCQKALEEAYEIAHKLNNEKLMSFIELAKYQNEMEISLKRKGQSWESIRKRRSEDLSQKSLLGKDSSSEINYYM